MTATGLTGLKVGGWVVWQTLFFFPESARGAVPHGTPACALCTLLSAAKPNLIVRNLNPAPTPLAGLGQAQRPAAAQRRSQPQDLLSGYAGRHTPAGTAGE